MHNLTGQWIPPNERSKFVTAYLGSSIGVAIAYPIFGFIIKASSWEWVFHICGISGIAWYMFWLYFVSFTFANFKLSRFTTFVQLLPGLRFARKASPHPPRRERLHHQDARIVCHAGSASEAESSVEGDSDVESSLDQHGGPVGWNLGSVHVAGSVADLFPLHSRLGN